MVKHAGRRMLQGLHNYLMDREDKNKNRLEDKARKRAEKQQQMAIENAGEGGAVKALDGTKYKGSFGVSCLAGDDIGEDDIEMEGGIEGKPLFTKSLRKQNGLEVSRRNHLIKKRLKKERAKEKRLSKNKVKKAKKPKLSSKLTSKLPKKKEKGAGVLKKKKMVK